MFQALKNIFKAYFLTGLLVLGPLAISYYVIKLIVDAADSTLATSKWAPINVPGFGLLIAIVIILFSGFLGKNVLGRYLFVGAGDVIRKIPVVGSIYSSTKQVFETLFDSEKRTFGRVVLVNYPHLESWSLAFVTSEEPPNKIENLFPEKVLSVYIPTTPNPTSGFYIFVPVSKTRPTSLTVDEAFKIIVSLGLVHLPPSSVDPVLGS
jgi:uncharacterized membrane protein